MKVKPITVLMIAFTLSIIHEVSAQVFQVTLNNHLTGVMGEFSENDVSKTNAGYVDYADGGNVELKTYIKKFGIGLRGSITNYTRDNEAYEIDLKSTLGITGNDYYFSLTRSYWSIGGDIGVSYLLGINEKLQFEPYFYFGFRALMTPQDEVVFFENSSTYTYRKNPTPFYGISYIPGLKFQWNITRLVGLNLYLEYEGAGSYTETEESVLYSSNTFETSSIERSYKPQSINFGLGLAFSLWKKTEK